MAADLKRRKLLDGECIPQSQETKFETTDLRPANDIRSKLDEVEVSQEKHSLKPSTDEREEWFPPSVSKSALIASTTFHSPVPAAITKNKNGPVVLGIDEAGRGPVLGPMVYGLAYALKDQLLPGFADSKVLKDAKRKELHKDIDTFNVGWATRTMTARDISAGMLRSSLGEGAYNLNAQAHDTTIQLIKEALSFGINVTEIYVDTVGPPATYQAKLQTHFPNISVTVSKKADSIYPIVSAASVVAKVTRDLNLQLYNKEYLGSQAIGSGYPSDPSTSKWLHSFVDPVFGWGGLVRFSWQTSKDSLKNHDGVEVIYEEEMITDHLDVGSYFATKTSDENAVNTVAKEASRISGTISHASSLTSNFNRSHYLGDVII